MKSHKLINITNTNTFSPSFLAIDERENQTLSTAKVQKRVVPVFNAQDQLANYFSVSAQKKSKPVLRSRSFSLVRFPRMRTSFKSKKTSSAISEKACAPCEASVYGVVDADVLSQDANLTSVKGCAAVAESCKKSESKTDPKLAKIETLYVFIKFQSFDGLFKPTTSLSEFFLQGQRNKLFQDKDQDSAWSTCIAMAYFEIVMKDFKEEWELCYEKAKKALDALSAYDSDTIEKMIEDARKWVIKWRT